MLVPASRSSRRSGRAAPGPGICSSAPYAEPEDGALDAERVHGADLEAVLAGREVPRDQRTGVRPWPSGDPVTVMGEVRAGPPRGEGQVDAPGLGLRVDL